MFVKLYGTSMCMPSLMYYCCFFYSKATSSNFIVGLTNVHPRISPPTLWNYTVCDQFPGAVPGGGTVSVFCQHDLPPFRYVIVQFPVNGHMSICELEVFAPGTHYTVNKDLVLRQISQRLTDKSQKIRRRIMRPSIIRDSEELNPRCSKTL